MCVILFFFFFQHNNNNHLANNNIPAGGEDNNIAAVDAEPGQQDGWAEPNEELADNGGIVDGMQAPQGKKCSASLFV